MQGDRFSCLSGAVMNSENAIEVRNMYKSFKISRDRANSLKDLLLIRGRSKPERHEVLNDITLDIRKGETVALIGTNGSGKSTLLKLMTKIIYPNSGTIETTGKLASLLELGAGFHQDFTGRENIYFNAAVFGLTKSEIDAKLDDIIRFSELGDFIDEPIRTYSSGMYMRLAFSVAINVDADILLIDEILAVGDQHFQDKCYAKLDELKRSDKTIVFVSHDLEAVRELCTRAVWIYKTHIRMDGAPEDVINAYRQQIADDHRATREKDAAEGVVHTGKLFIDSPEDGVPANPHDEKYLLEGWKISDCYEDQIELFIGEKPVPTKEKRRPDVFNAFVEQYGKFMDINRLGWIAEVNLKDYAEEIGEMGSFRIRAVLKDSNGNPICEEARTVFTSKQEAQHV